MSMFQNIAGISMEEIDQDDIAYMQMKANENAKTKRKRKYKYRRIDWEGKVAELIRLNKFKTRFRMSKESFDKLLVILRPKVSVCEKQSRRSTGGNDPIIPEVVVGCGLEFMAGKTFNDISNWYGMSYDSAVRIVDKFLDAVIGSEELAIKLPTTPEELKRSADEWDTWSGANSIYYGVVGAIDGWLASINKPMVSNDADYFSGHYFCFGLNVQAVCDARCRFLYFGVTSPGSTHDSRAFARCEILQQWIESLPNNYFLVGDNAYPLSNKLLIPYKGAEKRQKYKDVFNFYLSQMRTTIERSFGILNQKWRIFKSNLPYCLEKDSKICMVAAQLHNFVIENDNAAAGVSMKIRRKFRPTTPMEEDAQLDQIDQQMDQQIESSSSGARRKAILEEIQARDMQRPAHNIQRNQTREQASSSDSEEESDDDSEEE